MRVPSYALAAIALAVALVAGVWIADAMGFGKDPAVHCYGQHCP